MYAPYGTGALVGRRDSGRRQVDWPDRQWETGSPNVVGAVAQAKAMLCLQETSMDAVAKHETELTAYLPRKLTAIKGVQVYGIADPARAAEKVEVLPCGTKANLPDLVRVSFGCYNEESEIDWFIEVLERTVRGELSGLLCPRSC